MNNGIEYNGDGEYNKWNDEKMLIPLNSLECKIIADIMEDDHGLRAAWQFCK